MVAIDRHDGAGWIVERVPRSARTLRTIGWLTPARIAGYAEGVPVEWMLGIMYAESGGDPSAVSPAGAVGLMQIMPKIHGKTTHELRDPATNLATGARLLGESRRGGWDLVQSASRYNAGAVVATGAPHPSGTSPWGMREGPGYLLAVVRAHNWITAELRDAIRRRWAGGAGLVLLLLAGVVGWATR